MEFRDYVAKETSALLSRLLAERSESSARQLLSLREAFDAAARAAEAEAGAAPQVEADLQELVRRVNNAATAAVRASAQRIQDEAAAALALVRADLDAERARVGELAELLAEQQSQAESLRGDLAVETERTAAAERDLADARALQDETDAARAAAAADSRDQARARAAAEDEVRETRGLLDAALSEAARLETRLDAESARNDTLIVELSAARDRAADLEAARDRAADELSHVRHALDAAMADAARLSGQIEEGIGERAALAEDLDATREALADAEAALAAAQADIRSQSEARAAAEHELQLVRRSLEDAIADGARSTVQLEAAAAERGALDVELGAVRAELDDVRARFAGVEAERDVNREAVQALEQRLADQADTIHDLEIRLETALHAEASIRSEVAAGAEALASERLEVDGLRRRNDRLVSLLTESVRAADELAKAPTISELLSVLVRQLAGVYSRVAAFRLKGNRLEGEYQLGFDLSSDVTKLVIPVSVDSLIARAASSGVVESLSGAALDDSRHAPFGTAASAALAIPIVVRDETLAVVYAEEPGEPVGVGADSTLEDHATFAAVLARQTAALAMRLTQELKALTELRDYAVLLLQEAEQMHAADTESGKPEEELRRRLKDTIDCARQLYSQRASLEGPAAASILDDQIAAAIDTGTPFASDLAAAVGQVEREARAAEAS